MWRCRRKGGPGWAAWTLAGLLSLPAAGQTSNDAPVVDEPTVEVAFEIEYLPIFPHQEEPGDLFVYLDGDLLAWVSRGGQFAPTPPQRLTRRLAPGPHVLRLLAERHTRRSRGGWVHEARVAPVEILFRLAPGSAAEVGLRVKEKQATFAKPKGPISALVTQDGKVVTQLDASGSPLADWPWLCDEIEANAAPGGQLPRQERKKLAGCLRWETLWSGVDEAPSRDVVRLLLERYGYEPRTYKRFE